MLSGGIGDDIYEGGAGNDIVSNESGRALFNGGAGNDALRGGASAELYLGGPGNDNLSTHTGDDIILFNAGDGRDSLVSGGRGRKTLSLGGRFAYSDLSLSQSGESLVLMMGSADQVTFKGWYAATPKRTVVRLQVIAECMAGFVAGGSDPLRDQKIETFDFTMLTEAFDAARAAMPTLSHWALADTLSVVQLSGSDIAAVGGDLAYQYGRLGTLAGIGLASAQGIIGERGFGSQAQSLHSLSELQRGSVGLMS